LKPDAGAAFLAPALQPELAMGALFSVHNRFGTDRKA
jgi:hypothetical protein